MLGFDDGDVGEILDDVDFDAVAPNKKSMVESWRKNIEVNRLAPMGDLPLRQNTWRSRPTSIPYDGDLFPVEDEEALQRMSPRRRSPEAPIAAPESEDSEIAWPDPAPPKEKTKKRKKKDKNSSGKRRKRAYARESDSQSESEESLGSNPQTQESSDQSREEVVQDAQEDHGWHYYGDDEPFIEEPRSEEPAEEEHHGTEPPKNVLEWACTRFIYNGGDRMTIQAFRETMRDLWHSCREPKASRSSAPPVVDHQERTKDANPRVDFCWMCMTGLGEYDCILSTHMDELNKLFEKYVLIMHPQQLANVLYQYYDMHVFKPMLKNCLNPAPWTPDMAREHVLYHVDDIRIQLMLRQGRIKDATDEMYDNLFEVSTIDPTRNQHRPEVWRDIMLGEKMWLEMRKQNPAKMIGYNQNLNINVNEASNLVRYANVKVTIKHN